MDCRRIQVSVATLLMVMCLAYGVRGYDEVCNDKLWECDDMVDRETSAVHRISRQKPFNITAALTQCQVAEETMQNCQTEVRSLCSRQTGLVNTTFRSMAYTVRSVCDLGTLCDYEVAGCRTNRSLINEITDAGHQRPPDVQLIKEKCRVLNETVAPCVEKLNASCGNENTGRNAISSMTSNLDSLCGRGAMCRSQAFRCSQGASGFTEIGEAMRQRHPNVTLVMEKCRALNASVMPCVYQLQADCSDQSGIRATMTSLISGFNSVCGKGPMCGSQASQCSQGASRFSEIGAAMRQQPPNVTLIVEKCRALNASMMPCLHQLQADCSDQPGIRATLTSLASGFDGLCGKGSMCQVKLHRCQLMARDQTFKEGEDRHAQACRHQKETHSCLLTELDAQCRSLAEIKPVVDAVRSSLASKDCPSGGMRVGDNSILILLLAVFTAWATLLSL